MKIENIWTQNLVVSSDSVLVPDHVLKIVVNNGSLWIEESTPWR